MTAFNEVSTECFHIWLYVPAKLKSMMRKRYDYLSRAHFVSGSDR